MGNKLFVYGTLMTGERNHYLLSPFQVANVPAVAQGMTLYKVEHHAYPYPAMVPGSGIVRGELVELEPIEQALCLIDKLEEFFGPGHPDNEYSRELIRVHLPDGSTCEAWAYVWLRSTSECGLIPGGDWRQGQ